jgi:hypothetical protein
MKGSPIGELIDENGADRAFGAANEFNREAPAS